MLTRKYAEQLFRYDQRSGKLYWKRMPVGSRRKSVGKEVGWLIHSKTTSYRWATVDGLRCPVQNIIWLMTYGRWPGQIDHQDGDGLNNRIGNLRETDQAGNRLNYRLFSNNKSGHTGVFWLRNARKWEVKIGYQYKQHYLGLFESLKEAVAVRKRAERRFGFHENHGRSV